MQKLVEFKCLKDGWQKAIENPIGFVRCPKCNDLIGLGGDIELSDDDKKFRYIKKKTFDILKTKYKELWERNRSYATLPDDSMGTVEIIPFQGSGQREKSEYDRYIQLVKTIYMEQQTNYNKDRT